MRCKQNKDLKRAKRQSVSCSKSVSGDLLLEHDEQGFGRRKENREKEEEKLRFDSSSQELATDKRQKQYFLN